MEAAGNKQVYEDVFSFSSQLPSSDFSGLCDESVWVWDFEHGDEFGMAERNDTKDQMFVNDPFYSTTFSQLDLAQNQYMVPDFFFSDDFVSDSQNQQQLVLSRKNSDNNWRGLVEDEMIMPLEERKKVACKRRRDENIGIESSKKLSRETISQYFYMPITRAARELNVGLTLLKKRCRELGIKRWPHRKLISLQTLIKNVQEYEKDGSSEEGKLREHLRVLEQEKQLLEEIPDMQLEDTTKRLRQAFFKANYKKRKLMGVVGPSSSSHQSQASARQNPPLMADEIAPNIISGSSVVDGDGDEEFKYFMGDWFFL